MKKNTIYIKNIHVILSLIFFLFTENQAISQSYSNYLVYPTFELQMLNKQSIGLGLNIGSGGFGMTYDINSVNYFCLKRNDNKDFIMQNKICASICVIVLNLGIFAEDYTNFDGCSLAIGPEFGIGHAGGYSPWPYVCYYYNYTFYSKNLNPINTHNVAIRFWFRVKNKKGKVINQYDF